MAVEDARVRLRRKLESTFGAEEASILMDRPPGGWSDLVTNQVLEARLSALSAELRAEMAEIRTEMAGLRVEMARSFQQQTWRLAGAMFVVFGLFATLVRIT
jgi:hypothetical protein